MPSYLNSTGEQAIGNDITGTSDAIVMESVPDLALPKESEPLMDARLSQERNEVSGPLTERNRLTALGAAAAAGLLVGILLKKSLPAAKGRC